MLEWVYLTNRIRYSELFEDNQPSQDFCNYSHIKHQNRLFGKIASESKLAGRASWEAPGIDFGLICGLFWVPTSLRNGVRKRGLLCNGFEKVEKRTRVPGGGSAGLGPDRRGGVGEEFQTLRRKLY